MSQPRWETGLESANDVTLRKHARRIWGIFLKSQLSWELDIEREGSTFGARWGETNLRATDAARDGSRWKSQNRKNVYLSPYVEEPLNSKVIKSFVPKLRSRKCFFVFRDSYDICIYVMNILCTFHISASWLCNTLYGSKRTKLSTRAKLNCLKWNC